MLDPKLSTTHTPINDESDKSKLKIVPISGRYMYVEVHYVYFEEKLLTY